MAPSELELGREALAARRWRSARAHFQASLAGGESAEALEGLSWAAWWLDDCAAVFDARERAFRTYRARGDDLGAARMATWLAVDHLDFKGSGAAVSGWLARAARLLEPLPVSPEHGWLAFYEGYVANASGDTTAAKERARYAAGLGRRLRVPDLEMLGLALEGSALVACAEVGDGMRCLDEATTIALQEEAAVPIAEAWTFCFLVSACTATLDYDRAFEWCDRIAAFAEGHGSRYMLAFCRGDYGLIDLWRGRWAEAERMLLASIDDYRRSRPAMMGGALAGLAELRRRQGRWEEAAALIEQAGATRAAQQCRARLAHDHGDAAGAADTIERLLRQVPEHRRLVRAPLLEVLVSVRIALGDLDAASAAAAELDAVVRTVGTRPLQACAAHAGGRLAAARGDHERARLLLEDAVDAFAGSGAVYETALARLDLAASLAALGRAKAADREAAAGTATLRELGAGAAPPLRGAGITAREREVLALLSEGLTNRQIAARLVVSEHTVHRHVTNILRKLDQPTRTAAAAFAVRSGLAHPSA